MTTYGKAKPRPHLWCITQDYTLGISPMRMGPADADLDLIAHNDTPAQMFTMGDEHSLLWGGYLQVAGHNQAGIGLLLRPLIEFGVRNGATWIEYEWTGRRFDDTDIKEGM